LELVQDVEKNGFLHPAWVTDEGLLIDGRNRLCASIICEKDIRIERYNPVDPIQYVVSENLKRRHLTSQQRAAIAVEAVELYELLRQQAKERQKEAGENFGRRQEKVPQKNAEAIEESPVIDRTEKETRNQIARSVNTNHEYFRKAQKVKQHAPEKLEEVILIL
jgi:hypothetical protein